MWPDHMWGSGWMWVVGALLMVLFWGGIITLVVIVIRAVLRSGRSESGLRSDFSRQESALDILKARYARGEISRDEYLAMRRDIDGDGS